VACQAPTSLTSRLVCELKAKGQEKGEHALDKRLAVAKQPIVSRFVVKIDSDGPVFAGRSVFRMGHPQVRWSVQLMTQNGRMPTQLQGDRAGVGALPRNAMECEGCS
jgi:hypothetical protein